MSRDKWMSQDLLDKLDKPFKVGDKVARAMTSGRATNIVICEVTRIEDDRLYLDNSKRNIDYPVRLLIITDLPGM